MKYKIGQKLLSKRYSNVLTSYNSRGNDPLLRRDFEFRVEENEKAIIKEYRQKEYIVYLPNQDLNILADYSWIAFSFNLINNFDYNKYWVQLNE